MWILQCFEAVKMYYLLEAKAPLKMTNVIPPKKNKSNNPINQSERDMRDISPEESALESENDNI